MSAIHESPLIDKVVLVTGSARRIGAAIAQAFHGRGAKVAVHYHRSAAEAGALVRAMNAERPASAAAFGADLADLAALEALPASVIGTFRALDVLINNASTFSPTPVGKITRTAFEDLIGTNLRAPLSSPRPRRPNCAGARG